MWRSALALASALMRAELVLALARAVMRAELAARMRQVPDLLAYASRVPQVAIAGARLLYLSRRPQTR
jgi:hypothetical protein